MLLKKARKLTNKLKIKIMPTALGTLGMQVAQGAVGAGLGLLMEGHEDRRQLAQQEKLQRLQMQGAKEMTDYNTEVQRKKELQMWKDTSYPAQMALMKEAGINPALMYGMGGGGGTTTGGGGMGGSVSGAEAVKGSGTATIMAMNTAQMGLLKAQKENIEADTELKKVDATKKAGADTNNVVADTTLKTLSAEMQKMQNKVTAATIEERIDKYKAEAGIIANELEKSFNEASIATQTRQTIVAQAEQRLQGMIIENELNAAKEKVTEAEVNKINTEIYKMQNDVAVNWGRLSIEQQRVELQKRLVNFNTAISQRTYDNILKGISTVAGIFKGGGTTNIESQTKNIILPDNN